MNDKLPSKPETEREAQFYLLGMMEAFNRLRINFWGFGYDDDETGRRIRKITCEEIGKITDMLGISKVGAVFSSSVKEYVERVNKEESHD